MEDRGFFPVTPSAQAGEARTQGHPWASPASWALCLLPRFPPLVVEASPLGLVNPPPPTPVCTEGKDTLRLASFVLKLSLGRNPPRVQEWQRSGREERQSSGHVEAGGRAAEGLSPVSPPSQSCSRREQVGS